MCLQLKLIESIQSHADKVAIEYKGQSLSYASLLHNANKVTQVLLQAKLERETVVGICIQDRVDLICTVLGVINSRCVFVLIDSSLPSSRLDKMVSNLELEYVVTDGHAYEFVGKDMTTFSYQEISEARVENLSMKYPDYDQEDSIYIYHTSGSSGIPKGIIGKNSSLLHFLEWEIHTFGINEGTKVSQLISPYFDAFLRDIFVPLLAGGTICIPPDEEDFLNGSKLITWIDESQIQVIHCVPSLFQVINDTSLTQDHFKHLKYILLSGEKIVPYSLKGWYEVFHDSIQLVNLYGLTETTMIKSYYLISPDDVKMAKIPIGQAIDGTQLLIANKELKPLNTLMVGEIYIVSDHITKGYLNEPELTQETFVSVPMNGSGHAKAVKTGDLGRKLSNGVIELIGREDKQIKLRGIRVELDEVESIILKSGCVKNQVVLPYTDKKGNESLYAFITLKQSEDDQLSIKKTIFSLLEAHLPTYMIPGDIIILDAFPLLPTGKLDRKKILENLASDKEIILPRNDVEENLLVIWKEILGDKDISIKDVFYRIGGNSLTMIKLISKISKEFNVKIKINEIFSNPTIEFQAKFIAGAKKDEISLLPATAKKPYYASTPVQKQLFFLQEFDKESLAYNLSHVYMLRGELDRNRFTIALELLVSRHESFRTYFELIEGKPKQKIEESVRLGIEYFDAQESEVDDIIQRFIRPFDLRKAPLLRVGLITCEPDKHVLIIDMHHIISDETSEGIFLRDFVMLYKQTQPPLLPIQYKDYAEWLLEQKQKESIDKQKNFWLNQFENIPELLELPIDFPRPRVRNFSGRDIEFILSKEITQKLKDICDEVGCTMYMILLAIFKVLICKVSNQKDLVVGTAITGRKHAELENLIGLFVNILPLRSEIVRSKTFKSFLSSVKSNTLRYFENQEYPYEELVKLLDIPRDPGRNPLFDVMFEYQTYSGPSSTIEDLSITPFDKNNRISRFDLSLTAREQEHKLYLTFEYATSLFKEETIHRFIGYFQQIVATILSDVETPLSAIDILPAVEKRTLLHAFNETKVPFSPEQQFPELFISKVSKYADRSALVYKDQRVSYQELHEQASHLARVLRDQGIGLNSRVVVLMPRGIETITSLLAIFYVGGVYVPIDHQYPTQRKLEIIRDCDASMILMSRASQEEVLETIELSENKIAGLVVDDLPRGLNDAEALSLEPIEPSTLAYILYTSGSTGKPKGAMIHHAGMLNHLYAKIEDLGISESDVIAQTASVSFDISIWQMLVGLLCGAEVVILEKERVLLPEDFAQAISESGITLAESVPSMLTNFLSGLSHEDDLKLKSLRWMIATGESLNVNLAEKWVGRFPQIQMMNAYGPTEASDDVTHHVVDLEKDGQAIPIGKPIRNTRIYIVDKELNLCPQGVRGEICVSGIGVGLGYWGLESKSREVFIPNPFKDEYEGTQDEILYRTGDLGYFRPDGSVVCLGRIDSQVKVLGNRVELGEIEQRLGSHPQIEEVVVEAKKRSGVYSYLVAYYVSGAPISVKDLRSYLLDQLPDYMIPHYYERIEEMPLTPNGKLDRKALPDPKMTTEEDYVPPSNEIEKKLIDIWAEVLIIDKSRIGVHKSFFELGGHSLTAVTLVNEIHKRFEVLIPIPMVFTLQDVESQANYLNSVNKTSFTPIRRSEQRDYYLLTPSQNRIFFLYYLNKQSTAYNVPLAFQLVGVLDHGKLQAAAERLLMRHDSLRTCFKLLEGEPRQIIVPTVDFAIEQFSAEEENIGEIFQHFIRPFNLANAPLIRIGLVKINTRRHILIIDMHHIISDGISEEIIFKDLVSIYKGEELQELGVQYQDYAQWYSSKSQQASIAQQKDIWLNQFSELPSPLKLPIDFPRPPHKSYEGSMLSVEIQAYATSQLRSIAEEEGVTLYMMLVAIMNVLLSKLSNQEDIVLGTPVGGRTHADMEQVVGLFANTVLLRNYPQGELSFRSFLSQVKNNIVLCFDNLAYPYEKLIDDLGVDRDTSRNPLFDVMFAYQNFGEANWELPDLAVNPYNFEQQTSKFDLTVFANEIEERIQLNFEYATGLFEEETIGRFANYLNKIVEEIIENPNIALNDIDVLSEQAHQEIISSLSRGEDVPTLNQDVLQLFLKQVEHTPSHTAIHFEGQNISYKELDEKSDKVAAYLKAEGVGPKSLVGLIMGRRPGFIISILGIWKTGAAYIPIDPNYPDSRIEFIIEDANPKLLITDEGTAKRSFSSIVETIEWEQILASSSNVTLAQIELDFNPNRLAYIIYTSGSTGNPKGVMISHKSLENYVHWAAHYYLESEKISIGFFTAVAFDLSITSIFPALITGSEIVIYGEEAPDALIKRLIHDNKVDVLKLTPTHLKLIQALEIELPQDTLRLKKLIVGGETLSSELARDICQKLGGKIEIYNEYGPTEATVGCTVHRFDPTEDRYSVPVGKPIQNVSVYVLDSKLRPAPVGVSGEIYISGKSLAEGYLSSERLNREKFLDNPFIKGEKMYRSGDWAKINKTGEIEFERRIDNQIKLRGYRIELGEIEFQLSKHRLVDTAVVIAKEFGEEIHLVACYLAKQEIPLNELRTYMSKMLPIHMVPSYFVKIQELPLTANGKLDRRVLHSLDSSTFNMLNENDDANPKLPIQYVEEKLWDIWTEILPTPKAQIGVMDSFFILGGHSLGAIKLVNRIFEVFGTEIPLQSIFEAPTISEIGKLIRDSDRVKYESIPKAENKSHYPLSLAQQGIYLLHEVNPMSLMLNLSHVIRMDGSLDRSKMERIFQTLIDRHEGLRSSFHQIDGKTVQCIHENVPFQLSYFQVPEPRVNSVIDQFVQPFNLNEAPLFRVGLIEVDAETHIMVLDIHHLIADGLSLEILSKEFQSLYQGDSLPEIHLRYVDYAEWRLSDSYQEKLEKQEAYWKSVLTERIDPLEMLIQDEVPFEEEETGEKLTFYLGKNRTLRMKEICENHGVTPALFLLSIYSILLSKVSGQEDLIVGIPIAGREQLELESIVGMFAKVLPLRLYPKGELAFEEYLSRVRASFTSALDNQSYPYENLAQELQSVHVTKRNLWFDLIFSFEHEDTSDFTLPGLTMSTHADERPFQGLPNLDFIAIEKADEIEIELAYSQSIFSRKTITSLSNYFISLFDQIIQHKTVPLNQLSIVSEAEKSFIFEKFGHTETYIDEKRGYMELFQIQAEKTPTNIAVAHNGKAISYSELFSSARRVAFDLESVENQQASRVGIFMPRSVDMLVSILGIFYAGKSYIPLDVEYPSQRLQQILVDSELSVVLTTSQYQELLNDIVAGLPQPLQIKCVDGIDSTADMLEEAHPYKPDDLAYTIYTSGTTGVPKGVMIHHLGMLNHIYAKIDLLELTENDVIAQTASASFDISVWQFLAGLIVGAKTYIIDKEMVLDPISLQAELVNGSVTVFESVPSLINVYLNELDVEKDGLGKHLKWMISTGEALSNTLIQKWYKNYPEIKLLNAYGPTEASDDITHYLVENSGNWPTNVPIGSPVQNMCIYILDKDLNLCPLGMRGEICVSGIGVGKGYWKDVEKTESAFIANPLEKDLKWKGHSTLYRTGDLGYFQEDGNIVYLGRKDHQVKIRGNRIEIGEVENKLTTLAGIKEVAVLALGEEFNKYLVAFYVSNRDLNSDGFMNFLSGHLPDYMVPSYYKRLDSLPLTPNGKLDRKALASLELNIELEEEELIKPSTELEREILEIWAEELKIDEDSLGVTTSFFIAGGNSLNAISLINAVHKAIKVKIPLRDFFISPTIQSMANFIEVQLWINGDSEEVVPSKTDVII